MIRLQILVALFILSNGFVGYFAYNYGVNKEVKKANIALEKQIERHNKNAAATQKHSKEVRKKQSINNEKLNAIPLVSDNNQLSVDSYAELWNKAVTTSNSLHFDNAE